MHGVLDDALDRSKAGPAGQQDDRAGGVFVQMETAQRPLETQDFLFLHLREDIFGKAAARHVPDMQFQQVVVMRCIGERETAGLAVFHQDIDVLAGTEKQPLGGRDLELEDGNIMDAHNRLHPARQGLDLDGLGRRDFGHFDSHVALRFGTAQQGVAFALLGFGQGMRLKCAFADLA